MPFVACENEFDCLFLIKTGAPNLYNIYFYYIRILNKNGNTICKL